MKFQAYLHNQAASSSRNNIVVFFMVKLRWRYSCNLKVIP
ncbi:hypothetical protein FDUTEX481_01225 [Tolypothrix sp. PCC 7601]|nr:hypothetical protein FDUTEX481_01225 [Tolypothrix sp. PCC 7601]